MSYGFCNLNKYDSTDEWVDFIFRGEKIREDPIYVAQF